MYGNFPGSLADLAITIFRPNEPDGYPGSLTGLRPGGVKHDGLTGWERTVALINRRPTWSRKEGALTHATRSSPTTPPHQTRVSRQTPGSFTLTTGTVMLVESLRNLQPFMPQAYTKSLYQKTKQLEDSRCVTVDGVALLRSCLEISDDSGFSLQAQLPRN